MLSDNEVGMDSIYERKHTSQELVPDDLRFQLRISKILLYFHCKVDRMFKTFMKERGWRF